MTQAGPSRTAWASTQQVQQAAVAIGAITRWRRATRTSGPAPEAALRTLLDQLTVLRLPARERAPIVLLATANWLLDCFCLAAAILAVGVTVPWQGLLLAYLTAAGATTLALTPGGLGTVELAPTASLVAAGLDAPHAQPLPWSIGSRVSGCPPCVAG